ncbi:outer membrane lipoprotein [Cupriavidus numazuensis]|uniref:Glycine zipper 2TM domain-containing protein n=1 Tax=Cupriavidus numazuensis TaxID=221992 RepID=A0ABN7PWD3_9BURK|nr:glycine zipper 2TM domain-containing protein [Cupriavidus numazuensis]CAG2143628.1 hypothetical protein LMG26411_02415 [Cupriavidus numazuensis]
MQSKSKNRIAMAAALAAIGLAGCAAPYNNGYDTGYNTGYNAPPPPPASNGGYTTQAPAGSVYYGRVESIEPITNTQNSSGLLGTVIGGAAGGLLGHQVGGGRGQTAATIGGAVVGAVAGNQIEKRAGSNTQTAYRVNVRLDDGRVATVTQSNLGNLQVGMRARVANDMAMPY